MTLSALLKRFAADRNGNFAIISAVLALPILYAAGSAVDLNAAFGERRNMQEIADSAALAGGRVYNGSNSALAISQTEAFLKGYEKQLPEGTSWNVTMSGSKINVSLAGEYDNQFMQLAGINTLDLKVASQSIAPDKPRSITFTPTQAQGWYYKKVSIMVVRPGSTAEEVVGTVTYQPLTLDNGGQGTMTVWPAGVLDLGIYSDLILKMEIKNDACPVGYRWYSNDYTVVCKKTTRQASAVYDMTLRTDNPDTSYYLFVDGTQLPKGATSPLSSILACGKSSSHAWEDGGGWDRQDFFYTVQTNCAPDGQYVRLSK